MYKGKTFKWLLYQAFSSALDFCKISTIQKSVVYGTFCLENAALLGNQRTKSRRSGIQTYIL